MLHLEKLRRLSSPARHESVPTAGRPKLAKTGGAKSESHNGEWNVSARLEGGAPGVITVRSSMRSETRAIEIDFDRAK